MGNVKFEEFASLYCERQVCEPGELREKLQSIRQRFQPTGFMLLQCEQLDSGRAGQLTILPYGGSSTYSEPPTTPISPRGLASDMSMVQCLMLVEELEDGDAVA